jgi:hypothetical protein
MITERSHKNVRTGAGVTAALGTALLLVSTFTVAKDQKPAPQSIEHMAILGTTAVKAGPVGSGIVAAPEIDNQVSAGLKGAAAPSSFYRRSNLRIPSKEAARLGGSASSTTAGTLPLPEPVVSSSTVVGWQAKDFVGFNGLNNIDQRSANDGKQYSLEPPDQALCVGNGYVVEAVNDVIRVYDQVGHPLTGAEALNSFFGLPPAIIRKPNPNDDIIGPFLSDPR